MDGQLPVIYSPLSMSAGWEQLPRAYNKGYADEDALKLGVNVFMYGCRTDNRFDHDTDHFRTPGTSIANCSTDHATRKPQFIEKFVAVKAAAADTNCTRSSSARTR